MEASVLTRYYILRKCSLRALPKKNLQKLNTVPKKDLPPTSSQCNINVRSSLQQNYIGINNGVPQNKFKLDNILPPAKCYSNRSEINIEHKIFPSRQEKCSTTTKESERSFASQFDIKLLFRLTKKGASKALLSDSGQIGIQTIQNDEHIEKTVTLTQSIRRPHRKIVNKSIEKPIYGAFHLMTQSMRRERFGLKLKRLFKEKYNRKSSAFGNILMGQDKFLR